MSLAHSQVSKFISEETAYIVIILEFKVNVSKPLNIFLIVFFFLVGNTPAVSSPLTTYRAYWLY